MKIAFVASAALCAATAHAQTILIDYGTSGAAPTAGGVWNTIDSAGGSLLDVSGAATGVTATFNADWIDTSVNQGPWPAGDVSWVDGDATADYVFNTTGDVSTVTYAGLLPGGEYRFEHVAARSLGADRAADYTVNGSFADSTPNGDDFFSLADGWDGGNILVWNSVFASSAGEIVLTVDDVQNFGYVSASLIHRIPAPGSAAILGLAGIAAARRRR